MTLDQHNTLSRDTDHLVDICLALSREKDLTHLLDLIVTKSRQLTRAQAGSLYMLDGDMLSFEVLQNGPLNLNYIKQEASAPPMPSVPLTKDGEPNMSNVSSCVANTGLPVHIEDLYAPGQGQFPGVYAWDQSSGFRSISMLALPLIGYKGEVVAVLQLINRQSDETGKVRPFSKNDIHIMTAIASQAAVAIVKVRLIDELQTLMSSFVKAIAWAVDAKSRVTGEHINRVTGLTMRIARLVNDTVTGPFKDVRFTDDNLEELKYAAWMHDVGKIITPWHLIEKSTKLEGVIDGMTVIRERFETIRLTRRLHWMASDGGDSEDGLMQELGDIDRDFQFIRDCNAGSVPMDEAALSRLKRIQERTYTDSKGDVRPWLTEDERRLLSIRYGNLSDQERQIIQDHALMTRKILSNIEFPRHLERVPDYAASHHEKPDGSGYPDGLSGDALPLQARIMAIADIFEALTAKNRPYKPPMSPAKAESILGKMKERNEIDGDLYNLCRNNGIFLHRPESDDFFDD
ncbi:MAG: GAF domain-containing protein [Desulfobacterales bacterium]|nr:GAF domain-containing protein [Desulfobacterales bacterium]